MVKPPMERFTEIYHALQQPGAAGDGRLQAMVSRETMKKEEDCCCPKTFAAGFEFLDQNRDADNGLLHLECFDPHEPFHAPARFRERYPTGFTGPILDWWGKNRMPFYNEIAHIPLLIHTPRTAHLAGQRRSALTQTTDIMPTLLDLSSEKPSAFVEGESLLPMTEDDKPVREAALYGMFGAGTNITDRRYTYFRYPQDMKAQDLYEYTLIPMHQKTLLPIDELRRATLVNDFDCTQVVPLLRVPARRNILGQPVGHTGQGSGYEDATTVVYDLDKDPDQQQPFRDEAIEARLLGLMSGLMEGNEAPPEAFSRLDLGRQA